MTERAGDAAFSLSPIQRNHPAKVLMEGMWHKKTPRPTFGRTGHSIKLVR
jgi:hypothetical protein